MFMEVYEGNVRSCIHTFSLFHCDIYGEIVKGACRFVGLFVQFVFMWKMEYRCDPSQLCNTFHI